MLLAAAARDFDVLVSADQKMQFEQASASLPLPVILLTAISNRLNDLEPLASEVLALLATPLERNIYVVRSAH